MHVQLCIGGRVRRIPQGTPAANPLPATILSTRCLHRQFAWKVPLQGWPYCPEIYRSYGKHDSADDSAALWQLTEGLAIKNVTLRGHFLFNNINLPQV